MEDKQKHIKNLKEKKKKNIIGLAVFVLIALIAVTVFLRISENIARKAPYIPTISSTDDFPIEYPDAAPYQAELCGPCFLTVSKDNLTIYGDIKRTVKLEYSNPVVKTSFSRILIYENGGSRLRVDSEAENIYNKSFDGEILFAVISRENYIAVCYQKNTSKVFVEVYDDLGRNIYNISSADMFITAAFTDYSNGIALIKVDLETNEYKTCAVYYDFAEAAVAMKSETLSAFPYGAQYYPDNLFLLTDSEAAFFDEKGKTIQSYSYKQSLRDYSCSGGKYAVLLYNEQFLRYEILVFGGAKVDPILVISDKNIKNIAVKKDKFYLLTDTAVCVYNYKGELISEEKIDSGYDKILVSDAAMYLLGKTRIIQKELE